MVLFTKYVKINKRIIMKGLFTIREESYIVNKEKKVVTCLISYGIKEFFKFYKAGCLDILYYKLTDYLDKLSNKSGHWWVEVGISKCSPDDTFDEKKGILIAKNRAEIKLAQIEQKVIRKLCKDAGMIWDYTSELYKNREKMIEEKKNFIKKI